MGSGFSCEDPNYPDMDFFGENAIRNVQTGSGISQWTLQNVF